MLTEELRWFASGELDDAALRAFADDRRIEARTDEYRLGTGDALGLKRRGAAGVLELKRRIACTPVSVAGPGGSVTGVVERWTKRWPERDEALPGDRWLGVAKRRALRARGRCRAELTVLRVDGLTTPHLSLAFEVTSAAALGELLAAAADLFRRDPELAARFDGARSLGYPGWLERINVV